MPMTWTPNVSDPELFHITHVDNLPSILTDGGLHCDAVMAGRQGGVRIGDPAIKSRRLDWTLNLPSRPRVGDFVPFYFCPRSVMLYRVCHGHSTWSRGQDAIVHLVTRVSRVAVADACVFTDSNAATAYHRASTDLSLLSSTIDWSVMPLEWWNGPPMIPRQAEFLVPGFVPWTAVERVVARSNSIAQRVQAALGSHSDHPLVHVDPTWYY
jgi:hypothetical protein